MRARTIAIASIALSLLSSGTAGAGGDRTRGEEIVRQHCARCHVIDIRNRMGGIGSTPSFTLLRKRADWRERFETFHSRRPHPVHVRVEGVRQWTDLPPNATPFTITQENVSDILAFVEALNRPD